MYIISTAALAFLVLAAAPLLPVNPDVSQETLSETICVHGWTKTVRPPREYTDNIKRNKLSERGEPYNNARLYELDHIIPLELGGSPDSPENLQLQPWPEAKQKDLVENCLKKAVCAQQIQIDEAQQRIWSDWREAGAHCSPALDFDR